MARERKDLTPPYGYLVRLFRPFPDFDPPFIKPVRQKAVELLHLNAGDRVLDVGCGPGDSFPYLVHAVGQSGQVLGVEISPEISINAKRRITKNGWSNVQVIEAAAQDVHLTGLFDGLLMFAAPDVYASEEALENIVPHLRKNARVHLYPRPQRHPRDARRGVEEELTAHRRRDPPLRHPYRSAVGLWNTRDGMVRETPPKRRQRAKDRAVRATAAPRFCGLRHDQPGEPRRLLIRHLSAATVVITVR
jgi:SAM-dependent methyltransferase